MELLFQNTFPSCIFEEREGTKIVKRRMGRYITKKKLSFKMFLFLGAVAPLGLAMSVRPSVDTFEI